MILYPLTAVVRRGEQIGGIEGLPDGQNDLVASIAKLFT